MDTELQAGLKLLQENCSRGKVVVEPNVGGHCVYVTLFAPKAEQEGLLKKSRLVKPFKGAEQFVTVHVADLPIWACRLRKYAAYIV
ncbi:MULTISPECIES: hypothetical protein [Vibrio]|uniref:hypothetical protein n=1 Tax=Vibrio TaxID=662 RepID=UPI002075BEFA|nr:MULTISPECIES: hypothetical protein [Vibrio]USD35553.1 hypothetical protein J8Z27_22335 [Vibrio sp. SCSIO 43186]USD72677.1 hypothetical protein J4N41_22350 [Vibrio sp. SCSIO 43139]USD98891.1 hypothetical protein CTT30_22680 [Vibrio coralliilyticus]